MNGVLNAHRAKANLRLAVFFGAARKTQSPLLCYSLKLPSLQRKDYVAFLYTPYLPQRDENYERMLRLKRLKESQALEEQQRLEYEELRSSPFFCFPREPQHKQIESLRVDEAGRERFYQLKFDSGNYVRYFKNQFYKLKKDEQEGKYVDLHAEALKYKNKQRIYLI